MKYLLGLALAVLLAPAAWADGVPSLDFTWSGAGVDFTWIWPAFGPESRFTTFTEPGYCPQPPDYDAMSEVPCTLHFDASFTEAPFPNPYRPGLVTATDFICINPLQDCDAISHHNEVFDGALFTESHGILHFIPGTYGPAPGITDLSGAILTIAVATPESSSITLLVVGIGFLFVMRKRIATRHVMG